MNPELFIIMLLFAQLLFVEITIVICDIDLKTVTHSENSVNR